MLPFHEVHRVVQSEVIAGQEAPRIRACDCRGSIAPRGAENALVFPLVGDETDSRLDMRLDTGEAAPDHRIHAWACMKIGRDSFLAHTRYLQLEPIRRYSIQ